MVQKFGPRRERLTKRTEENRRQEMLDACIIFSDALKEFIKSRDSGGAAVDAAQCLFSVHRLENVLDKERALSRKGKD